MDATVWVDLACDTTVNAADGQLVGVTDRATGNVFAASGAWSWDTQASLTGLHAARTSGGGLVGPSLTAVDLFAADIAYFYVQRVAASSAPVAGESTALLFNDGTQMVRAHLPWEDGNLYWDAPETARVSGTAPDAAYGVWSVHSLTRQGSTATVRVNGADVLLGLAICRRRAVATEMLEALGASVVAVERGARAIEEAAARAFDVALVDLHMPEMDGLAVVRALRASPMPPNVIVFTADGRPSLKEECLAAGASELLMKPATSASLARAVLRHTSGASRPSEAGARPKSARQRLVEQFALTYPVELEQLRRATAGGDAAACDEVLHGMLGASTMLGFADVARLCREARGQVTLEHLERLESACVRATARA